MTVRIVPTAAVRREADARIAAALQAQGVCDAVTIDRARRVAEESGQPLAAVLLQLGLVSETVLAGAPLLTVADLQAVRSPVWPERFSPGFLRRMRCLPMPPEEGVLRLAMADALDEFTLRAVARSMPPQATSTRRSTSTALRGRMCCCSIPTAVM